ncbi:ATP-binding protein [Pseudonocardia xinjiangensis]|uniref:ATP-binding protein n=1 Tax=Pseudonocardia xinjiangensis TaxID=75289 RepID=UPI003D8ECE6A
MDQDRRLVGREATLAAARVVLDEVLGGAGQLLLVSGEPGIGKSALLGEVVRTAAAQGARVLRGTCWEAAVAPPYWPWTQVLRSVDRSTVQLGEAARLIERSAPDGPSAALPFEMFDAVARVLAELAAHSPVAVVLDDLQWADEASVRLLSFLRTQLAADRVLLLGAFRDTESGAELRRLTETAQLLQLGGLTADDVAALMRRTGGPHAPLERAEEIRSRCGGNPFFVREVCRLGVADGWDATAAGRIPDGVLGVLRRRLGRLSAPCAAMLTAAAVAGRVVEPEVLGRALPTGDAAGTAALIDEAVAARVLAPDGARTSFVHDLYRETLLADCPSARLAELHAAVGAALRDVTPPDALTGDRLSRLAAHFVAAGPPAAGEAVRFSVLAARDATSRLGHEDACRHYELALGVIDAVAPPAGSAQRTGLLVELGAAQARAGSAAAARTAYDEAVRLGRAGGEWEAVARAAIGRYGLGSRDPVEYATVISVLEEADKALAASGTADVALRCSLLATLARARRHADPRRVDPEAVEAAEQAVALAAGHPRSRAESLLALHDVLWVPGRASERLPVLDEMLAAAVAADDPELVAVAHQLTATALIETGDPAGRLALERYVHLAAGLGHARGRWGALSRRATLAELAGRVEEATDLAGAALELGSAIGEPDAPGCFATLRSSLMAIGGPELTLDLGGLDENDQLWPVFPLIRALAPAFRGRYEEAAERLGDFAVQDVLQKYDLELVAVAATVFAAVGSDAQRTWTYERLVPVAGLHVVVGGCAAYYGPVDHLLGELAAGLGRRDEAVAHLTAAARQCDRLGAAAWSRRSLDALARLGAGPDEPVVERDGGTWRLAFRGRVEHLPDAKGLRDLAVLLGSPGRDVHVLTLLGRDVPPTGSDPVLDDRAMARYRHRLGELDGDIDEAVEFQDLHRAERLQAERDALLAELAAATGLGGRPRRLGDETERARKTVGARIRDALRRVDAVHPELAEHLRATVGVGTVCRYTPQPVPTRE